MTTNTRSLKVFLCHASEDKPIVRELHQQLKSEAWLDVWYDEERLLPGQDWDKEIEGAVESADAVIVCVSNKSVTKEGYVQRELRYALDIALEKPEGSIFIIPLRLDKCTVPRRLRELQWVDYFPDARKPDAFQRLLKSCKMMANKLGIILNGSEKKQNPLEKNTQRKPNTAIIVALIGFAGSIVAGLLSSPLIEKWFPPPPPSITPVIQPTQIQFRGLTPATEALPEPSSESILFTPTAEVSLLGRDGMPLILIPAGEFTMGSDGNDADERPVHTVYLDAFLIDKTEVTNAMYAECVKSKRCDPPRAITSITQNAANDSFYYGNPDFDDYPVIFVSWIDAKAYCRWAGRRLPTEAEWEKAASWDDEQKTKRLYPWGNTIDCSYANFYGKGNSLCVGDTTSVGSYLDGASYYGVLDMAGNVWEWIADRYAPEYYGMSEFRNPIGPASGDTIVRRGGSFLTGRAVGIRSSDRDNLLPDNTSHNLGFRCAVDAP